MNNAQDKQRKQLIILIGMIVVLALVVLWMYVFSPMITESAEMAEQLETKNKTIDNRTMQISLLPVVEQDNKDLEAKLKEKAKDLFEPSDTEEIDAIIIKHFKDAGLEAESLSIANAESIESVSPFQNDTPAKGEGATVTTATPSGVKGILAAYTAKGTYYSLLNFISKINSEKAMLITDCNFVTSEKSSADDDIGASGPVIQINPTMPIIPSAPVYNAVTEDAEITAGITILAYIYDAEIPDVFLPDIPDVKPEE